MINIVFEKVNNLATGLEVTGHANSGPHGQDLVCAGVSCIAIGGVNGLLCLEVDGDESKTVSESGLVSYKIFNPKHNTLQREAMFAMLYAQFATMEKQYPQHIKLSTEEVQTYGE